MYQYIFPSIVLGNTVLYAELGFMTLGINIGNRDPGTVLGPLFTFPKKREITTLSPNVPLMQFPEIHNRQDFSNETGVRILGFSGIGTIGR